MSMDCIIRLIDKLTENCEQNVNRLATIRLQWAPLKGITLGPRQTDSINRMIPLTDTRFA
jgi:hypothetical protein